MKKMKTKPLKFTLKEENIFFFQHNINYKKQLSKQIIKNFQSDNELNESILNDLKNIKTQLEMLDLNLDNNIKENLIFGKE